jgi:hypothetical protein
MTGSQTTDNRGTETIEWDDAGSAVWGLAKSYQS